VQQRAEWEAFDEVVFASHSDDALLHAGDPARQSVRLLGAVENYQPNDVVLHARMHPDAKLRQNLGILDL